MNIKGKSISISLIIGAVLALSGCNTLQWLVGEPYEGSGYLPEIKWPAVVTNALPATPGAETKPETSAGDVAGIPCAGIPITATLTGLTVGKRNISWSVTGIDDWDKKLVNNAVCRGMTYLYVWRGDKWVGRGKFDWFRHGPPPQTSKQFENLHNGYYPNPPQKGERVAFGLVDIHGKRRTNFREGVWQ